MATVGSEIPKGVYIGERLDSEPVDESEHWMKCPACGGWLDMRDLGQVFEHFDLVHARPAGCPSERPKPN